MFQPTDGNATQDLWSLREKPMTAEEREAEAEEEQKDAQYEDPDFVASESKRLLSASPYGSFTNTQENDPNQEWTNPEQAQDLLEAQEAEARLERWLFTPTLTNFIASGEIPAEEWALIQEALAINPDINALEWLEWVTPETITKAQDHLKYTTSETAQDKAATCFEEDFGEQFWFCQDKNGNFQTQGQLRAYESIAKQYFPIGETPEEISPEAKEAAFWAAIETAFNIELDSKQFKQDQAFLDLSSIIRNPDKSREDRFTALVDITGKIDLSQSRALGKRDNAFRTVNSKKNAARIEALEIAEAQKESQETSEQTNIDQPEEVSDAKKEINTGDVDMWGWEDDILSWLNEAYNWNYAA